MASQLYSSSKLSISFGNNWDALAHVPYAQRASELDEPELRKLDAVLRNVLRHLEVVCINMKHQIIDEKVCYEYLHSILTTFYETCIGLHCEGTHPPTRTARLYRVGGVRKKMEPGPRTMITTATPRGSGRPGRTRTCDNAV